MAILLMAWHAHGHIAAQDRPQKAPRKAPFAGHGRTVVQPRPELEGTLDPRNYWQDRLIVKFSEDHEVRLPDSRRTGTADEFVTRSGKTYAVTEFALTTAGPRLGSRRVEMLFSRSADDLRQERRAILAKRPDADLADLANYYRVFTSGRQDTLELMRSLWDEASVETCYPEFHPRAIVPAQTETKTDSIAAIRTPLFESRQGWLAPAPDGIGMLPASDLLGAQGHKGQTIVQIEAAWTLGHEDIPQLRQDRVLGPTDFGVWNILAWRDHGTAAVGILTSARDERGVRGVVPESSLYVSSVVLGNADAVSRATKIAGPGDVFSSSLVHAVALGNQGFHAPFDFPQDAYDAVRIAVAKGIVMTVAAGNTGNDLANPLLYGYRYASSATPSGAWIIGATYMGARKKVAWSNYGDVVRFSSWGAGVTAPAYGQLFRDPSTPETRSYTDVFGGTSAASPQVAGAAAAIQSASWMMKRRWLDVDALASALELHGTSIQDRVGPRPDIAGTLAGLGLVDGLRIGGEAKIGSTFDLELDLRANEVYAVLASLDTTSIRLPGFTFPLTVDLGQSFGIELGTMPKSGPYSIRLQVPGRDSLAGSKLFIQTLRVEPKSRNIDLTNPVEVWLRAR
ncbi:MAG: S8 family serine peptidase [Planctomycetes bacterium]|nr:S8 family serine peptidase [Planctomycetota bacterium]